MVTFTKTYDEPPVCEREILRYAGCRAADAEIAALLHSCMQEARDSLCYRVCYGRLPVTVTGTCCDFGVFSLHSEHLARNLTDCTQAVLLAATIGVGIDRLVAKYGRTAPSKAVMLQAIGAERIEALCDVFCRELASETPLKMRPRFSPGYGDLPLSSQKEIFSVLDCTKRIGVSLNDSLLMSPTKSVTAFVGFGESEPTRYYSKCSACHQQDCAFRGVL